MRNYAIIFAYIFYESKPKLAHEIRGWLVRMSKNLWVPDRCWPRICTSIVSISRRRYEGEMDRKVFSYYKSNFSVGSNP